MPDDPNELEEVQPDLRFFDPATPPAAGHSALASPPVKQDGQSSSAQFPAVHDGQSSSTQNPVAGSQQNQRQYLRFRIEDVSAQMYAKGLLSTIGLGRANIAQAAVNLSEGGILLLVKGQFKPGTRVHIRIELEKVRDVLDGDGIVRWCAESARSPGRYFVGVQFENLPSTEKSKIRAMRTWFTSREYKLKSATRRRTKDSGIQTKV